QQHPWGWAADGAVQKARKSIAENLNCKAHEIFFTSGATESNNWALQGLVRQWHKENSKQPIHILSSTIEHSSVKSALQSLQELADIYSVPLDIEFLPVDGYGFLQPETFRQAIRPSTKLLSLIWVNNEVGTIQDMSALVQMAREKQVYVHSDATQAVGKIPVDLQKIPVDLLSFSGHKIYGPKGVGALFVRSKNPAVQLQPLLYGGGQEQGLRSGTLNVPGIVGMAEALRLCHGEQPQEWRRQQELQIYFWQKLQGLKTSDHRPVQIKLNGASILQNDPAEKGRSPVNLNISFLNIQLSDIQPSILSLGVSSGSACGSGSLKPSSVLLALGLDAHTAQNSLRLSLGRWTQKEDIDQACAIIQKAMAQARLDNSNKI
ncbi:MAG: cysteine desulfurase family protein, partial [Pseudobdellovibrionaceae bacterium]